MYPAITPPVLIAKQPRQTKQPTTPLGNQLQQLIQGQPGATTPPQPKPTPILTPTLAPTITSPGPSPTLNPVPKPTLSPTPKPTLPPVDDNSSDDSQPDQEADATARRVVRSNRNPLLPLDSSIDGLVQRRISDDTWQAMKGKLPCLELTESCTAQLGNLAVSNNQTLKAIDQRLSDTDTKIKEAQAKHQSSVTLSIVSPIVNAATSGNNPLKTIFGWITAPVSGINKLLSLVASPLTNLVAGGSDQQQSNQIAVADLQLRLADARTTRDATALKLKTQVVEQLAAVDQSAREFQIAQSIAIQKTHQLQVAKISYSLGESSTETYMGQLAERDTIKAHVFQSWVTFRRELLKLKLMVLGIADSSSDE